MIQRAPIFLVVTVLLGVLLVGGVFYVRSTPDHNSVPPRESRVPAPSATATSPAQAGRPPTPTQETTLQSRSISSSSSPTSLATTALPEWETYKDDKYKFQFKYP